MLFCAASISETQPMSSMHNFNRTAYLISSECNIGAWFGVISRVWGRACSLEGSTTHAHTYLQALLLLLLQPLSKPRQDIQGNFCIVSGRVAMAGFFQVEGIARVPVLEARV